MRRPESRFGARWGLLDHLGKLLGPPGGSLDPLGGPQRLLGGPLEAPWRPLGDLLEASWTLLGPPWALLAPPELIWELWRSALERSWTPLEGQKASQRAPKGLPRGPRSD